MKKSHLILLAALILIAAGLLTIISTSQRRTGSATAQQSVQARCGEISEQLNRINLSIASQRQAQAKNGRIEVAKGKDLEFQRDSAQQRLAACIKNK